MHEVFTWTQWHHCFGNFPFFYPMKYIPLMTAEHNCDDIRSAITFSSWKSRSTRVSERLRKLQEISSQRLADYIPVACKELYCGFGLNWMFPLSALGQNSSCSSFSHLKDLPIIHACKMRCFVHAVCSKPLRNVVVLWYICGIRCCIDFVTPSVHVLSSK